jgi:hypothetical protein
MFGGWLLARQVRFDAQNREGRGSYREQGRTKFDHDHRETADGGFAIFGVQLSARPKNRAILAFSRDVGFYRTNLKLPSESRRGKLQKVVAAQIHLGDFGFSDSRMDRFPFLNTSYNTSFCGTRHEEQSRIAKAA